MVQIENSVESPQETITETLSAGVVPNANYSVVVFAKTHTWNSSTAPHNLSECVLSLSTKSRHINFCFLLTDTHFKPKTCPLNGKNDQMEVKISFLTESVVHVSTQLLSLPIVLSLPHTHCLFSALVVIGATAGPVVLILTISVLTTIFYIVLSNRRKNRGLTPTVCVCIIHLNSRPLQMFQLMWEI